MAEIKPFEVSWSEAQVEAVLGQVRAYPWPPIPEVPDGWAYGCDAVYLKALCAHWTDGYDWRAVVADLNRFPQFTADVEDFELHFLHVIGEARGKRPLIVTHGWPGSHYEFWGVDFREAGLSRAGSAGRRRRRLRPGDPVPARLRLFVEAHAPDRPADHRAAVQHPDDAGSGLFDLPRPGRRLGRDGDLLARPRPWRPRQGHPPQHAGLPSARRAAGRGGSGLGPAPGRDDGRHGGLFPPAGLQAAVHRLDGGGQPGGPGRPGSPSGSTTGRTCRRRRLDEAYRQGPAAHQHHALCDDRQAFATGALVRYRGFLVEEGGLAFQPGERCETPTAFANFPGEPLYQAPPRSFAERAYNIIRWTDMPRGGHFAAMEEPDLFVDEVRAWANSL